MEYMHNDNLFNIERHIIECLRDTGDSLYLRVQGTRQNTSSYQ